MNRVNPSVLALSLYDGEFIRVSYDATVASIDLLHHLCTSIDESYCLVMGPIGALETTQRLAVMLEVPYISPNPTLTLTQL